LRNRIGAWLFRHRTSLPLPIALAILIIPAESAWGRLSVPAGVALTVVGELIRLWGVRHIGTISRTRSDRLGPLVASGPFAFVRNPLYLGNILLWVGFALIAQLVWLAPVAAILLAAEYHAIVRWEEELLEARIGQPYRDYAARVPRWVPAVNSRRSTVDSQSEGDLSTVNCQLSTFSWSDTLFSERGTLIAMAAGYLLLWLKARS
jgi:protein-S-isoprenylcysteine O-methyltransferase Ste14